MRHVLHRKAGLLLVLLVWLAAPLSAQNHDHSYDYDRRALSFGFQIGGNFATARPQLTNEFPILSPGTPSAPVGNIRMEGQAGFNIGLIANLRVASKLDLRFVPAVSLQQRDFFFQLTDGTEVRRRLEGAYLELPLYLKYKSDVYRNIRVFVQAGPKLSINLASDEDVLNDPELLKLTKTDIGLHLELGVDLYGDRLKLTPAIGYTFGLNDIYVAENEQFPGAIRGVYTHMLLVSVSFGG